MIVETAIYSECHVDDSQGEDLGSVDGMTLTTNGAVGSSGKVWTREEEFLRHDTTPASRVTNNTDGDSFLANFVCFEVDIEFGFELWERVRWGAGVPGWVRGWGWGGVRICSRHFGGALFAGIRFGSSILFDETAFRGF